MTTPDSRPGSEPAQSPSPANSNVYAQSYSAFPGTDSDMTIDNKGSNVWAIVALVLGVLSLLTLLVFSLTLPLSIIGVIVSIVALLQVKKYPATGGRKGMAIAGLILNGLAFIVAAVFVIVTYSIAFQSGLTDCFTVSDPDAQQQCLEEGFDNLFESRDV